MRRFMAAVVLLAVVAVVVPKVIGFGYRLVTSLQDAWSGAEESNSTDEARQAEASVAEGNVVNGEQFGRQSPLLSCGNADPEVLQILEERYHGVEEAAEILAHPEEYPDVLLTLLSKRPETLTFVSEYLEKKGQAVAVDLDGEITKGVIPRLYQWDQRWGYGSYGDTIIALAGCGPTCLSMVLLGLTGDSQWDPARVSAFSEAQGYVSEAGTAWDLMTLGAQELGLSSQVLPLDEGRMTRELNAGHPIICSMRPGDFTDTGHFIVLVGYEEGAFVVNDPNSIDNSERTWTYEEICGQIRNLWAFSLE